MSRRFAAIATTSNGTDVSIEFQLFEGNGATRRMSDRTLARRYAQLRVRADLTAAPGAAVASPVRDGASPCAVFSLDTPNTNGPDR
jgi:hypothetical protein